MRFVMIVIAVLLALIALVWIGLQIKPAPFSQFAQTTTKLETVPLSSSLPAPVERFYRKIYGDKIPVITSAVITGRATLRIAGIQLSARFRFIHVAGHDYRHYIEATLFGVPIFKVNERYVDGISKAETPGGIQEGSHTNQAANLGLWSETIWFPSVFLTDPRVKWLALDDASAILVVPFEKTFEHFVVRFDPETNLVNSFESMRYQSETSAKKILWLNQTLEYRDVGGYAVNALASVTWMDVGTPWAVFTVEDIVLNANVNDYVRARGQ